MIIGLTTNKTKSFSKCLNPWRAELSMWLLGQPERGRGRTKNLIGDLLGPPGPNWRVCFSRGGCCVSFFFGYYVFRWIRVYFSFWSFRWKPSNQDHVRIHDWVEVAVQRFPSNDIKGHSHSPAYWRPAASPGLVRLSLTHTPRAARWKLTFLGQVDSPYFLMTLCTMVMWPQPRFCSLGTSRHSWRSGWLRQNVCY